jgi:hypothetical protein
MQGLILYQFLKRRVLFKDASRQHRASKTSCRCIAHQFCFLQNCWSGSSIVFDARERSIASSHRGDKFSRRDDARHPPAAAAPPQLSFLASRILLRGFKALEQLFCHPQRQLP